MPNTAICQKTAADAAVMHVSWQATNIPSHVFSCVYLTSSTGAAELASTLVKPAQIHIHRSTSLDDAKARLKSTKSHTLLADVSFDTGGWEDALRMAARLAFRTAVVLVSRLADERLWIDALERGAYDLILEPFHAEELRRILESAHFRATRGGSCHFCLPSSERSQVSATLTQEAPLCACY
jgi:DNA-binding NtrC family response regulator